VPNHVPTPRPPVVVVAGPTASCKTGVAIALALRFRGEIVNADSMQVYRHLDVGTAKPSLAERARVPHHLFDVVTPDVPYNAGRYVREARAAAAAIHARGGVVFLTGGTGLYIRAFLEGLIEDDALDTDLRREFEREAERATAAGDPTRLHRQLAECDPAAAERIHPNDLRRTIRALELARRYGAPASRVRERHAFQDRPYRVLYLVLDPGRDELDRRIETRTRAMIEGGLLKECRALRDMGYGPELRSLQSIGYRHLMPVVDGSDTLVNAEAAMQRDTKRFARRQRTWFRSVADAVWMDPREIDAIASRVATFLDAGESACATPPRGGS
jgi:tRNA dimethylallyltransferase